MDATKKKYGLDAWEASLKRGGKCGVREQVVASLPSSAEQRSPSSAEQKVHYLCLELYSL